MSNAAIIVWFDSACPLCTREIKLMRMLNWNRAVEFVDIYAPDASCPIAPEELLSRFHAQDKAGVLVSGAAAFALMWRHIPLFWPLGQIARIPFVLTLLEKVYLRFLVWRQKNLARRV